MKNVDVWIDDEIVSQVLPNNKLLVFESNYEAKLFEQWWENTGKKNFVRYYNSCVETLYNPLE